MSSMGPAAAVKQLTVDPDGDLILLLNGCELRVSSKVLSLTSSVFKAMLGPNFAEGNPLPAGEVRRISLPDDDTTAMCGICSILHYRLELAPSLKNSTSLEEVSIATDKYDCVRAMSLWSKVFLSDMINEIETQPNGNGRLLYPTYALDDVLGFARITKHIVFSYGGSNYGKASTLLKYGIPAEIQRLLPTGLLATLDMNERELKTNLQSALEDVIKPLLTKRKVNNMPMRGADFGSLVSHHTTFFSECDSNTIAEYFRALSIQRLWPLASALETMSVAEVLLKLEHCTFWISPTLHSNCTGCHLDVVNKVKEIMSHVRNAFSGLCLDCVKYGEAGKGQGGKCRFSHAGYLGLKKD